MYARPSDHDNAALVQQVVELLSSGRAGLITDVDGTLSPIVERPAAAQVPAAARAALAGLRGQLDLVGVVSGRSALDARRLVGVDGLTYVGNHGLEILDGNVTRHVSEAEPWVPRIAAALAALGPLVDMPGLSLENKGLTATIHYRRAPDPELARRELLESVEPIARANGLRIEEGRLVLNLLPPLSVDKGTAVTALARSHRLERLVYLGDDVTDTHAFLALRHLRDADGLRTLSIGVVGPESPMQVRELADAELPSVAAVIDLLSTVLSRVQTGGSMQP